MRTLTKKQKPLFLVQNSQIQSLVDVQHQVMDIKNKPLKYLHDYAVEMLFYIKDDKDIQNEQAHQLISQGIIHGINQNEKGIFHLQNFSPITRKYLSFYFSSKELYLQNKQQIFLISYLQNLINPNTRSTVLKSNSLYAKYKITKALGCFHAPRGAFIKCPECALIIGCPECHALTTDHDLDISLLKTIICLTCEENQPFSSSCRKCQSQFGNFSCKKCKINLFQSEHFLPISHCQRCDKCHVQVQGYMKVCQHCDQCYFGLEKHVCREGNCGICLGSLKYGKEPYDTPCKHMMHQQCVQQLLKEQNLKCPMCRRTVLSKEDNEKFKNKFKKKHQSFFVSEYGDMNFLKLQCNDCQKQFFRLYHPSEIYFCDCLSFCNDIQEEFIDNFPKFKYESPIAYQFSDVQTMADFLIKRHGEEIARDFNIQISRKLDILNLILVRLDLQLTELTALQIGIVYDDSIHNIQDLINKLLHTEFF